MEQDSGNQSGSESGGAGAAGNAGAGGTPEGGDDKEAKRLEAELESAKKKADELERKQKEWEKKEREAEEAKRLENEGAKKLLEERNKELAAVKERMEKLQAAETARAERMFKSLPEGSQKKLEPFKEKMSTEDWVALLEAEAATTASSAGGTATQGETKVMPPPSGSPLPQAKLKEGETYQPTPQAIEFLNNMSTTRDYAAQLKKLSLQKSKDEDSGAEVRKFTQPIRKIFQSMGRLKGTPVALGKKDT